MRYNALVKMLALVLAVLCGVTMIISGLCVICNLEYGYYYRSPEEKAEWYLTQHGQEYVEYLAERMAFEQSGMPEELWEITFASGFLDNRVYPRVAYRMTVVWPDGSQKTVDTRPAGAEYVFDQTLWASRSMGYAEKVDYVTVPTLDPETEPTESTQPPRMETDGQPLWKDRVDHNGNVYDVYRYEKTAEFTLELFYTQEQYEQAAGGSQNVAPVVKWMYGYRYWGLAVCIGSGLVLILLMVYLGLAAGRKPGTEEVMPRGLNRLPLDLYAAVDCGLGIGLVYLMAVVLETLMDLETLVWGETLSLLLLSGLGISFGISLICILYWCAFWAQVKAPNGYWWKNTIVGRIFRGIWRVILRFLQKILGTITGMGSKMGEKVPDLPELLRRFNDKLPLMWQWLTVSIVWFFALAFFGALCGTGMGLALYLIMVVFCVAAILYGANAFGTLRDTAKRMSRGELDIKINPDTLEGCFRDFAEDLNALSDACMIAAREQLKSERMKTELITNVSHDIKTPLTSIINYVDLLQKAETEAQRVEYLAVLERQSLRLKKLIEDLMEMSKASSGNVAAEITPTDVVESVNQALGEYADRFEKLGLTVLFRCPQEPVMALCDGKLLWRVLSNVMTNVVKYAMPGTRVYLDLTQTEHKVQLALKNISREELNISAEALMERFVRGDESRNTEGNGLGLNIAGSLMEVQGGSLELVVDGDLFKVILTLPAAENC